MTMSTVEVSVEDVRLVQVHLIEDEVIALRKRLVEYRSEVPMYVNESEDRDHYATLAVNLKVLEIAIGHLLSVLPKIS